MWLLGEDRLEETGLSYEEARDLGSTMVGLPLLKLGESMAIGLLAPSLSKSFCL